MSIDTAPISTEDYETIRSIVDLVRLVENEYKSHGGTNWIYRGQPNFSYSLIPSVGRGHTPKFPDSEDALSPDLRLFELWKVQARCYSDLPEDEFDCLAFAQHHGLKTRLLDWTSNPLVALFFAIWKEPNKDGAIFIHRSIKALDKTKDRLKTLEGVRQFTPNPLHPRVISQKSVLTIHPDPKSPIETEGISYASGRKQRLPMKLKVPAASKGDIRYQLKDYGIDESRLFPGLEGAAGLLNWEYIDRFDDHFKMLKLTGALNRDELARIVEAAYSGPATIG